jgi:hypothetical protein
MVPLMNQTGLDVVRITFEDYGYNYNAGIFDQTVRLALSQLCFIAKKKA